LAAINQSFSYANITNVAKLNNHNTSKPGISPKIRNRIMPGIKKSSKGDRSKIDRGKPPSNFPDGEIIKAPPPPMALRLRNTNSAR